MWVLICRCCASPLSRFYSFPPSSEGPASCALLLVVFPHCGFPFLRISFRFLCKSFILSLYLTLTLYLHHMYLLTRWLTFYSTFSFSRLVYIFCFLFLLSCVYLHFHPRQLNIPFLDVFLVPFLPPLLLLPFFHCGCYCTDVWIPLLIIISSRSSFVLFNSFRFNHLSLFSSKFLAYIFLKLFKLSFFELVYKKNG